jgi:hypothetical protein
MGSGERSTGISSLGKAGVLAHATGIGWRGAVAQVSLPYASEGQARSA